MTRARDGLSIDLRAETGRSTRVHGDRGRAQRTVGIPRPQRWDRPFDPEMTERDVDLVMETPVFQKMDPKEFPQNLPLRGILLNDARIRHYEHGEVIVRAGDFGGSFFQVMAGRVRGLRSETNGNGRSARKGAKTKRSLFSAVSQLWRNSPVPERRNIDDYPALSGPWAFAEEEGPRERLADVGAVLASQQSELLTEDDVFGETEALTRQPYSRTYFVEGRAVVLELRWQGLRDIRRCNKTFRARIDSLYQSRDLRMHLQESPLFRHLDDEVLDHIARNTLFETHGEFEWAHGFKRLASESPQEVVKAEPVIAEYGDYLDGLILIRSGFGRITEQEAGGLRTAGFLTRNETFGLPEIIDHWRRDAPLNHRFGLHAVGYVDLLRVPTVLVERFVLPSLPEEALAAATRDDPTRYLSDFASRREATVDPTLIDFLVNTRTMNGTAVMAINTDRCTSCDDCVRACAATHDNNPRFVRHGPEHENIMIANACLHCVDAVCLIGCPTGAIHRDQATGNVVIDDTTCIGCATCANSCPYDNIRMVDIRDQGGALIVDQTSGNPIVKATKCDLCIDQLGGPACQRACPHDALIRLDLRDRDSLWRWASQ